MTTIRRAPKSQELCRMSWFLIEMDEGLSNGANANGNCLYEIVHAVEIDDKHSENMYVNRRIRFYWKQSIMDGQIVMASDDRSHVQKFMEKRTRKNEQAKLQRQINKKYLVQYKKGTHIVHAVIDVKDVAGTNKDCQPLNMGEIIISNKKYQRLAQVLHDSDTDDSVQQELDILKSKCFQRYFRDGDDTLPLDRTPWLLVQYSSDPKTVRYSIVNIKKTVFQAENLYPNVVAYLKDGMNIHQCIILRKSTERNEIKAELARMMAFSLSAKFPLSGSTYDEVYSVPLDQQGLCSKPLQIQRPLQCSETLIVIPPG